MLGRISNGSESNMAVLDGASTTEACKQSRKCSKAAGHRGRCNSEKPINPFWESSSVFKLNTRKRKLIDEEKQLYEQHEAKREMLDELEETLKTTELAIHTKLREKEKELCGLHDNFEEIKTLAESTKKELSVVTQQNEHLKSMISSLGLDCKQFTKSKREQNSTSPATKCTTRFRILHSSDESPAQRVTRLALGRIVLHLREACSIFNKVSTTQADLQDLDENCKLYFNLMCLFFPTHVNITSWTVAYAIPYHAFKLYEKYKVGYGIISQQGKEAKHCGVKNDLALSNRSMSQDTSGKWWQVTRANYVRSFYLPEHQPMPNTYKSHFQSRVPPHCQSTQVCNCGRAKAEESEYCETCLECDEIVKSAESEKLSEGLTKLLKPLLCTYCGERFADESILETHISTHSRVTVCSNRNPKDMTVAELKIELKKLNVSTVGTKDILIKRLEMKIAGGC